MNFEDLSNLVITRVRSVSTLYTLKNVKLKRTARSCWSIVLKYEGETVYTSNGKNYVSDAEHIAILPQGCSYEWVCTQSGHFCIIDFECPATHPSLLTIPIKNGKKILSMMKELEYKRNLKRPMTELESIRDVYSILLALIPHDQDKYMPSEKQKRIAPALEYISQHYNQAVTNDELAAMAGLSTVYFRKLFAATMNISPIAYAHKLRIEKAKEMLASDYGTLSDVAQALGYADLYDFSRDFKKHVGVSPSRYQNKS